MNNKYYVKPRMVEFNINSATASADIQTYKKKRLKQKPQLQNLLKNFKSSMVMQELFCGIIGVIIKILIYHKLKSLKLIIIKNKNTP